MEKDIEELRTKIEEFCKKYNVTVEIETSNCFLSSNGSMANIEASITVHS